jgi:uncharacterized protein (UPF0335 family)
MDSLWDKIKQSLVDSASAAAEKAEYLGKIGRARLDIAETRHAIRDRFADLGGLAYENLQSASAGSDLGVKEDVKQLIDTISSLEDELKTRDETLSNLRADAEDSEEPEAA